VIYIHAKFHQCFVGSFSVFAQISAQAKNVIGFIQRSRLADRYLISLLVIKICSRVYRSIIRVFLGWV